MSKSIRGNSNSAKLVKSVKPSGSAEAGLTDGAGKQLLENAYDLRTAEDNRNYYDKLAKHYDKDFAHGLQYQLPAHVQQTFSRLGGAEDSPVLDVGCGTGLLGDVLASANCTIDGVDISPAMLAICKEKGRYRALYEVDLTQSVESITNQYGAVLSSGTFTHGHLGTDAFVALLTVARTGALFVIAINKAHYNKLGFSTAIENLTADNLIESLNVDTVNIYAASNHAHSSDEGLIVSFRKL